MFNKVLKLITSSALLACVSTVAMADLKFSGDFAEYIGQYNDGSTSYMTHFGEAHLKSNYSDGKVKAYLEIELRDEGDTSGSGLKNAQRWVSYQAMEELSVKMGTVVNSAGVGFAKNSGIATTRSKSYADFLCIPARTEVDGLQLTYKIKPLKGKVQLAILPESNGNTYSAASEQAMAAGLDGKIGDTIALKVGLLTAGSKSANNIGAKMSFGEMSVSVDVSSSTISSSADFSIVQFKMKSLGPGGLTVTAGTESKSSTNYTSALYKLNLDNNAAFDLFFLSQTSGSTTKSNIGGGLTLKF